MTSLETFLVILALAAYVHPANALTRNKRSANAASITLEPQPDGGFEMVLLEDNERKSVGLIDSNLMTSYTVEDTEDGFEVHMEDATLTVHTGHDNQRNTIRWMTVHWNMSTTHRISTCFNLHDWNWYGGRMKANQIYPIQNIIEPDDPYYSKEHDNGAIAERYWFNTNGEYFYVFPEAPLFVNYNNKQPNHLCLENSITDPYSLRRDRLIFEYHIRYLFRNVREAHMHAVRNYLGKPSGVPDFRMVQHPIWSTWAQYSRDIDDSKVLEFANQIRAHGFNDSHFEIDDMWETCYGSLTVDQQKFPDFAKTVRDLKSLGYRVTLWVHPFINKDCEPYYSLALHNGYLVLNEEGSPNTTWWNDNGSQAGYIDFTNENAASWFVARVRVAMTNYGIDSFKFDAGESSFTPQIAVQTGYIGHQPHHIVESYVRTAAIFGNMVEVRAGFTTQDLPIFVRMAERDSTWGMNNGLSTIITTTFQMNLAGYTLVMPDMIGGKGYNLNHDQADLPTKELFIRWVQANTFLPAMKFSFAPWNFDNETVEISKKYTELHAVYAEDIYAAMQASAADGTPVNAPLWWLDPTDENCQVIADEYLLGENILVAPVLVEGATNRDIYLPVGTWWEEDDSEREHVGPTWLRNHPAPLDYLPYFVRQKERLTEPPPTELFPTSEPTTTEQPTPSPAPGAAVALSIPAFLVLCGIMANFVNAL